MRLPEVSLSESMPRLPSAAVMSVASKLDFSLRASAPNAKPIAPPRICISSLLTLKSMKSMWALPISVGSLTWAASIAAWPSAVWAPNGLMTPLNTPCCIMSSLT